MHDANEDAILKKAMTIIKETRAGVLATIDEDGSPNMRWMATHSVMGSLKNLYTITSPASNKSNEVGKEPRVTWLFTRVNFTEVLKVRGKAYIDDDPQLKSQVWDRVGKKTWKYFS